MEKLATLMITFVFSFSVIVGGVCLYYSVVHNGDSAYTAAHVCTPTKYVYCPTENNDHH